MNQNISGGETAPARSRMNKKWGEKGREENAVPAQETAAAADTVTLTPASNSPLVGTEIRWLFLFVFKKLQVNEHL